MPGGASYEPTRERIPFSGIYDEGIVFKYEVTGTYDGDPVEYTIHLKDGTKIVANEKYGLKSETITDPNGNWIRYNFSTYTYNDWDYHRVSSIIDSVGRTFYFTYLVG